MVEKSNVSMSEEYVNVFKKGHRSCRFPAPTIKV